MLRVPSMVTLVAVLAIEPDVVPEPNAVELKAVELLPPWMISAQSVLKSQPAVPQVPCCAAHDVCGPTDGPPRVNGDADGDGTWPSTMCEAE
ncbi:hypothetical protein OZX73_06215 [Bifidobacterium sp. ESL0775]|uniref:hypothetical protein n=1 Tax=Bifidobacterium sp. ESL0775 TaxID=2983230 RepID=UPI0023F76B6F|nr:hypothetical protein [Bifidobacterium sp. ESL0775]WEV68876.1 hypothetical protein OZX73_06215 [Bifidobacterium sp. ESL0775]